MQENENNPYSYQNFDEVLSSRIRLAALALLAGCDEAEFTYIRNVIQTTDGNLASHLRKLEEAGYVEYQKRFIDRKPATYYRITPEGRAALLAYSRRLTELLKNSESLGGTQHENETIENRNLSLVLCWLDFPRPP